MTGKITLAPFDGSEFFHDAESQVELLSDALLSGDTAYITHALNLIARARGMSELARETGLNRSALYDALGPNGNPTLDTLMKLLAALKLQISGVQQAA